MADNNNDSIREEQENDTTMDTSSQDKVEDETKTKQEAEKKDEKSDAESDDDDDDAEDENKESESEREDEELPPGLLEQPLEMKGKREKKKVDRLTVTMVPQSAERKKIEIKEGSGIKLGEIDFIENKLNLTKAIDLKPLHRLLFLRPGANPEVKRNIRQFSGFAQPKDSKDVEKRLAMLNKMYLPELKSISLTLGLERSGTKKDVVDRIIEFLMSPSDKGMRVPKSKKAKRASKSSEKRGTKRKRTKKTVKKDKSDKDNEEEDEEGSLDEEDDDISDEVSAEEEESEEAPIKKKAKIQPQKKKASDKVNGKKEKAPVKPKKEPKKASPKEKKVDISDDISDDSSDDSDDEPIANMKKSPPSNDEIKDLVKKILEGADLESVTMKTVVKEVYSKYPTFDLSDRKDFIKSTVREVIS